MSYGRIILIFVALVLGVIAGCYGQPLIHDNEKAVGAITTFFSIFAGFIIAITTILGTPVTETEKQNWRSLELRRDNVFKRLTRQKWLFVVYMVTLTLIFAHSLLIGIHEPTPRMSECIFWIEKAFLGLSVFAFILSFGLPWALINIQISRYDELIEDQKKKSGSTPP